MSWTVVIGVGGAIVGGAIASEGAKDAAKTSAKGSDAAAAEAARQFDTIQSNTAPYRAIGEQALNSLGGMYGYKPSSSYFPQSPIPAGATPFEAQPYQDRGFGNSGTSAALNPWTVTSQLGSAGKWLDPAGGLLGNLFSGHGDEKRNLKAFTSENKIYDLGNGMLSLADGTQFRKEQLQDVAGAWYGATYAPDGDRSGWQSKYGALIKPPANVGQAGGGLTSDGVNQGMSAGSTPTSLSAPDYSAFFKSPDYQFRKTEGMTGIGNAFSASGGAKSGNALKALAEFNSNLAAGEFGNYFNRQAALAGIGQTATNTSANAGIATGQIVGNALQNSADARASGVAGSANAIGAGLSGAAQGFGYWNANRKPNALGANNWGYGVPRGSYA
jgi:hypothetical protein